MAATVAAVWVEWAAWAVWTCKNLPGGAVTLLRSLAVQNVLSARMSRVTAPPDQVFLLDPQIEIQNNLAFWRGCFFGGREY
jgi:hypothetical protein